MLITREKITRARKRKPNGKKLSNMIPFGHNPHKLESMGPNTSPLMVQMAHQFLPPGKAMDPIAWSIS